MNISIKDINSNKIKYYLLGLTSGILTSYLFFNKRNKGSEIEKLKLK